MDATSFIHDNQETQEEIKSPKSVGAQLLASCKSGTLSGIIGKMIVKDYLQKNPDLTVCDYHGSALMWAAYFGFTEIVELLITNGARLDISSKRGYTALHAAAQQGHLATVTYLQANVAQPLEINVQSTCGSTALHLASLEGRDDVVSYFLEQGASVDLRDSLGRTALHLAAWKGHVDVCKQLLEGGGDKNARANGGITPLYAGVCAGMPRIVRALILAGADHNALTDDGESIIECAHKCGHVSLVRYFQQFSSSADPTTAFTETIEL